MRRIAFRSALCSALCFALVAAPLDVASAAPAKKPAPTTTAAPATDPAATPPATGETPPGETPPGETPPVTGETPPGETPPGETPPDGETPPEETPPEETPAEETPEKPVEPPPPTPPDPMADRPEEPRIAGKPRKGVGMMIAGGATLGAGLAATITFGMITQHCKYSGPLQCKYQDQDKFLIPMGAAATLLGAILLGVGAGYYGAYKKWERWTPEVAAREKAKLEKRNARANRRGRGKGNKTALLPSPTMIRGGAGFSLVGRF
ncbi:MAG TPA: hypothetical protein VG755_30050 [Nannocystaceae bacterium]|nr:hypothetical protein [Nannocystaceae bacterium]